jgi:light-regulated signal transduction histidine kinase (bacteriophytochrome)
MTYDVTERLKFQRELERSNQELEQFAYVASHDLQEPLRVITGFVQLLEKRYASALDQNGREYMAFIVDAAARMKELINDMLAYSRVTTKTKPPEAVDLNDTLATVRENLSRLIKETRAEISCDQALPMVQADRAQMGQLLQNLITNAIRYHRPEMPPKIRLTAVLQGKEWLISVTDNGIGIEQRYFTRIFKIFQRLHTNDEHPGTGIGLAICKKIIERHQGRIWVQSEPDQGATFLFTLPVMTGFTAERPSAE